jgi:hypothetical protein
MMTGKRGNFSNSPFFYIRVLCKCYKSAIQCFRTVIRMLLSRSFAHKSQSLCSELLSLSLSLLSNVSSLLLTYLDSLF